MRSYQIQLEKDHNQPVLILPFPAPTIQNSILHTQPFCYQLWNVYLGLADSLWLLPIRIVDVGYPGFG